jgi:chaperone required for assembly of F1-ATPase
VEIVEHPQCADWPTTPKDEVASLENCSLNHSKYWAVKLDGRVLKTLYKDPMVLPSRALAVAVAEEWEK